MITGPGKVSPAKEYITDKSLQGTLRPRNNVVIATSPGSWS